MHVNRIVAVCCAAAVAVVLGACAFEPIPMTAQIGSSVLIPLQGLSGGAVGYGAYHDTIDANPPTDPQRGVLIYSLDTPSGPVALETRGTWIAGADSASQVARGSASTGFLQVVSLVDIPTGTPEGTYDLEVTHHYTDAAGQVHDDPVADSRKISILPQTVTATHPDGTTEQVTGQSTPMAYITCKGGVCTTSGNDVSASVQSTIPDPAVGIVLDSGSSSIQIWAADLTVTYPSRVINVVDAMETPLTQLDHLATVWYTDSGLGSLDVQAVATEQAFKYLSIVFNLVDGSSQILDPTQVHVTVNKAWDQTGAEIPVTASVSGID